MFFFFFVIFILTTTRFAIASGVSILLVITYLRIVVGSQFALREAALAQLTFLVLFSFAFFFRGYTGLLDPTRRRLPCHSRAGEST